MIAAILTLLGIFGWLGVVFAILLAINTGASIFYNMSEGKEAFSWKKFFKGIIKSAGFYLCCGLLGIAFTLLPFINAMIVSAYGITIISEAILNTLSAIGVLGAVVAAIVNQGKKALEGIGKLGNISSSINGDTGEITWTVIDPETETEDGE